MDDLQGRIVEIGAGSGTNFSYYPAGAETFATEPDPHMLKRARAKLDEIGSTNIEVRQAPAERLSFEDASFDHALCTWVLCTVDDLTATRGEIRRVLRPEGTFRVMEACR